jgi:DnaD/phage-associated family protein
MEKDAYYFPHFSNARHDRKVRRLVKELGVEGYGIFFMTLEVLREQMDYRYPMDDIDLLADEFGTSEQKLRVVICNYKLFLIDEEDNFFSPKFIEFMQPYLKMKEQRRLAGKVSAEKRKQRKLNEKATTVERPLNECGTTEQQSKVKESKVKENKEEEVKGNTTSSTSKLFNFYNNNYGMITPFVAESINSFLDDGVEEDLMLRYLEIGVENNKKSWGYVKAVAQNNLELNIKTLEQFNAKEVERQNKNIVAKSNNKVEQCNNFDQRDYSEQEFEQFYS